MLQLADEKMSKSEGNIRGLSDALDEVGRDALLMYFVGGHYRQPIAYTRERLDAAARQRPAHPRCRAPPAARRVARGPRAAPRRLLRRARRRLQHRRGAGRGCSTGSARRTGARAPSATPSCARCSRCLALDNLLDADGGPPEELVELARQRTEARAAQGLRRGGPAARRGARRGLGDPRRPGRPRARARGVIIYGRNAVTGGPAGPAAGAADLGRRRGTGAGAPVTQASPADITARCGSDAHQGVCADVEDYRYADAAELLARAGAVPRRPRRGHRPAEPRRGLPHGRGRGRHRRDPARAALGRGHARGLQGVGGGGRAPRDRAGPQPRRLPRATPRQAECWVYGADAGARTPYRAPDYRGGVVLVLGAEGKGLRPRVRDACDDLVSLPVRGRIDSLNVSAAAAVLMYEILQQRLDTST